MIILSALQTDKQFLPHGIHIFKAKYHISRWPNIEIMDSFQSDSNLKMWIFS